MKKSHSIFKLRNFYLISELKKKNKNKIETLSLKNINSMYSKSKKIILMILYMNLCPETTKTETKLKKVKFLLIKNP